MAYQCWTCGSEQNSKKFLKNHMATEHKHLSVICPYCYPKETTLGRISDLKKHVEKKHPNIYDSLHKSFFTEGNGFYLCHNPQEYVRHVSPTQPSSDEARQAMEALKLVIPALNAPSRELQLWESGWLQAVGTPLRDDSVSQSSPHVVDECGNQFIATKVTPGYSPSRPEMLELTDDIVYFDSSALECIVSDNDLMYYVKLLTRPSLYQNVIGVPPSHYGNNRRQVRGQDYYEMSSKVASTFNICQFNVGEIYLISPISVKAVSLLYSGCMPLFPPALRDWSIPECQVTFKNESTQQTVVWPPQNWTSFTPEKKRLVFMAAVLKLDEGNDGLPTSDEFEIFDMYNFLRLPGTLPTVQKNQTARMRYLNFCAVRDYLKTKAKVALAEMLTSQGHLRKPGIVDGYLGLISHIPIRM